MLSLRSILSRTNDWFWRERMLRGLSITGFLWLACSWAHAQQRPAPRVYTYVEQMPQLPGGGGQATVVMEVLKRAQFPAVDLRQACSGRAAIYLEVSSTGTVQHVKLLRATGVAGVDSALTTATWSLPRFTPGYQSGRAVTVSMTLAISCIKPQ